MDKDLPLVTSSNSKELALFRRFLFISIAGHLVFLTVDPANFFFSTTPAVNEGTIDIDLIAFEMAPPKFQEEDPEAPPMLPQVTKKFELEVPKKPEEMTLDDKPEPVKEEDKIRIEQKKQDEKLTKASLERLIEELNRKKAKESDKKSLLTKSLQDRKKNLESGLLRGTLALGDAESGYASIVSAFIRRNYTLPEIPELRDANIEAIVQVAVNAEGGIAKLTLKTSSHNDLFDQSVLKTVENSAPFPPPPREAIGQVMTVRFTPKAAGN